MTPSVSSPQQVRHWRRGFWSLIITQFQGAFSDNALKYFVLYLLIGAGIPQDQQELKNAELGFLFSIPFILFSMAGGYLAAHYSKRSVTIATKVMELCVIGMAIVGLAGGNLALQFAAIFLIGTQAALFAPSKYGLLPELLPEERLSWGNGVLELGTFLAIITGTMAGALLAARYRTTPGSSGYILSGITLFGLLTSFGITRLPAAAPERSFRWNPMGELWSEMAHVARTDSVLNHAIIGNAYFFFVAALLQLNIPIYATVVLHLNETQASILQVCAALGIGFGSLAAGYLSGHKIELGLIPLGSIGMTIFGGLLHLLGRSLLSAGILLALLGFFAGFFVVPLNAIIQHRPHRERQGAVIAAANLLSFVGVFLASGAYYLFTHSWHFGPHVIFFAAGAFAFVATLYVLTLLPMAFVRLMFMLATHTIYKIRVVGRENIPVKSGALFVSNHLSFVDALLLAASTDRNIRFIMFQDIYDSPFIKPIARLMKAIPISSNLRPRDMIRSLRAASEAIREGRVVCIFAEGEITRIGRLLPFRRGMERIMKGVEAPIVPVHLEGVWGSMFSFERGKFFWKLPRYIPFPVTVSYGKPMPATSTAMEVRAAVQQLETAAFQYHKQRMEPLHRSLVAAARKHPRRFAMADGKTPHVTFGKALMQTIFLARRMRKLWQGQKMVGILMPPSVGGALVNYAATLSGKVPVNFNYTASNEIIASCAEQCEVTTTVTAKAFLERLPNLAAPGKPILLEDLAANPRLSEKLTAFFMAWMLSARMLERALGGVRSQSLDDLATVIFSSGSTGDPKGVMLSHYNIASNIDQMGRTFALDQHDRIMGILPFFHSFGYTATLWLPVSLGMGVVFHPNPLDAVTIGALVRTYSVTFLVATPTFLQAYIRRVPAEDFGSLQFVIVGAEKLPERVAQAFEDTFGIRPLEGYGCTECAPVVAVNTKDFRGAGFRQVGAKRGKIGHPLPGVSVRIVDPESGIILPVGQSGLLQVSGPNVMMGYLGKPQKTAEVLKDDWYNTGDIAVMDEDGFLTITDRLSRFSKIAGEMVPHIKVEEKLHECVESTEQIFAVTGVPDGKKGERLIVLHTLDEAKLQEVLACFAKVDLPPLWKPRPAQFMKIEAIPYLGTGKLDLRKIKEMAAVMSESAKESGA
jgi:acyl-[acyl-carrier-protein]-phospholipid O-acyltransferase/long-chain-fatty-acid--[acyl-carrier-protein] ligase